MTAEEEILSMWRAGTGKKPGRIAKETGLPIREVLRVIAAHEAGQPSAKVAAAGPFREPALLRSLTPVAQYDGYGRPELREFLIARRTKHEGWDNQPTIASAREEYDAGIIEMCQGRDGDWLLLYRIPRKVPAPPRAYFSGEYVG